jgi:hypothetical protein
VDLSDVEYPVAAPVNGDILVYSATLSEWINVLVTTTYNLDDLSDVVVPSPVGGDVLTWDSASSKWVNKPPAAQALAGLTDVLLTAPAVNNVLTYDGVHWINLPPAAPGGGTVLPMVYPISNYGAAGNGTTDDTTAIKNMLAAASTAGGGICLLDAKKYLVLSVIDIPSNTILMGTGQSDATGSAIIGNASTTSPMVRMSNITGGQIRNLRIDAGACTSVTPLNIVGTSAHCLVENVTLYGSGAGSNVNCTGLTASGGNNVLRHVRITSAGGTSSNIGFNFSATAATDFSLYDCQSLNHQTPIQTVAGSLRAAKCYNCQFIVRSTAASGYALDFLGDECLAIGCLAQIQSAVAGGIRAGGNRCRIFGCTLNMGSFTGAVPIVFAAASTNNLVRDLNVLNPTGALLITDSGTFPSGNEVHWTKGLAALVGGAIAQPAFPATATAVNARNYPVMIYLFISATTTATTAVLSSSPAKTIDISRAGMYTMRLNPGYTITLNYTALGTASWFWENA